LTSSGTSKLSPLVPEIVALLGGIVSAVIVALPVNTFFEFLSAEQILLAPLVEEPVKAIGLLFLAINYPYVIATKSRGLLLGGLAGLGFAFTENLFYATMPQTDVVARALLPVPMHIMASGIAALGLVYLSQNKSFPAGNFRDKMLGLKSKNVLSLFVVAVVMHTQYNILSYFGYLGSVLGLIVLGFVYYRLDAFLPEDLRSYPVPGPASLLRSTVRVRVLRHPFSPIAPITPRIASTPKERAYCMLCGHEIVHGESYCDRCGGLQQ
jgi:RsiW-degrading membrane proteinase PrsW (M82 family)